MWIVANLTLYHLIFDDDSQFMEFLFKLSDKVTKRHNKNLIKWKGVEVAVTPTTGGKNEWVKGLKVIETA